MRSSPPSSIRQQIWIILLSEKDPWFQSEGAQFCRQARREREQGFNQQLGDLDSSPACFCLPV